MEWLFPLLIDRAMNILLLFISTRASFLLLADIEAEVRECTSGLEDMHVRMSTTRQDLIVLCQKKKIKKNKEPIYPMISHSTHSSKVDPPSFVQNLSCRVMIGLHLFFIQESQRYHQFPTHKSKVRN